MAGPLVPILGTLRAVRKTRRAKKKGESIWEWIAAGVVILGTILLLSSPLILALFISLVLFNSASSGDTSISDIPPIVVAAYVNAAARSEEVAEGCVLRPAIVAGIGSIESGHGTFGGAMAEANGDINPPIIGPPLDGTNGNRLIVDTDDGDWDDDTVYDRAVGPMQFIPSSWRIFGQDGNNDGVADPQNIFDAALAAVAHLCSTAAVDLNENEDALYNAIFSYNNTTEYVASVLAEIERYDLAFSAGFNAPVDVASLLEHPNFTVYAQGREDLEAGRIDPRVIAMLSFLVQTTQITVSSLKTGHDQCVGGGNLQSNPYCTESHHWHGRGVDISHVDGRIVNNSNEAARAIVELLVDWPNDPSRPEEVGSPWAEYNALPGFFNDANHEDHLHIGWCGPRMSGGRQGTTCP